MVALIIESTGIAALTRQPLATPGSGQRRDEKWLQDLLYRHPELIPMDQIDGAATQVVPICRELGIPRSGGSVFLDLLCVTPQGRLVLIECKLWRNPQARREVIAQIFEYAALLRAWDYADLTAKLKAALRWSGANPLFEHARRSVPSLDEAAFVDGVSRSLRHGDFDLIVVGDGIRSDLQALTTHLNERGGLAAQFALVEVQQWVSDRGQTVIVPVVPVRTEILTHRIVVDQQGLPVPVGTRIEDDELSESAPDPDRTDRQARDRAFWQRFIETAVFDHPDQPPPRHGGRNWVRLVLPGSASLTVYRTTTGGWGSFVNLSGEQAAHAFEALRGRSGRPEQRDGTGSRIQANRGPAILGEDLGRAGGHGWRDGRTAAGVSCESRQSDGQCLSPAPRQCPPMTRHPQSLNSSWPVCAARTVRSAQPTFHSKKVNPPACRI